MATLFSQYASGVQFTAGGIVGSATGGSGLNAIVDRLNSISTDDNLITGSMISGTNTQFFGKSSDIFNQYYSVNADAATGYNMLGAVGKYTSPFFSLQGNLTDCKIRGAYFVSGTGSMTWELFKLGSGTPSAEITGSINTVGTTTTGIAWDGINMIVYDNIRKYIYKHNGFTSEIIGSFAAPDQGDNVGYGLGFANPNLISSANNMIYIHSGVSATLLGSFSATNQTRDVTYDGTNLLSIARLAKHIYVHSGISATLTGSFATPGTNPIGLAYDGGNIISTDANTLYIYLHDGISATLTGSFAGGGGSLTYGDTNLFSIANGSVILQHGGEELHATLPHNENYATTINAGSNHKIRFKVTSSLTPAQLYSAEFNYKTT